MMRTTIPFLALLAALAFGCGSGEPDEAIAAPSPTPFPGPTPFCVANENGEPGVGCLDVRAFGTVPDGTLCCDGSEPQVRTGGRFEVFLCCGPAAT